MNKSRRTFFFISGIASGFLLVGLILGSVFISYKLGFSVLNMCDSYSQNKKAGYVIHFIPGSRISFESSDELKMFEQAETSVILDDKFATNGKHSLLIEFPAGTNYPGIFFDVMGKNCLNWKDMKTLSCEVLGDPDATARITLKLKSGADYPKKSFEKEFTIPAKTLVKISVTKEELAKHLDLGKISYMKLFIETPGSTYQLRLDNIELS